MAGSLIHPTACINANKVISTKVRRKDDVMQRIAKLKKLAFPLLTLLTVVVTTFSGEVLITSANRTNSGGTNPKSCTLVDGSAGSTKLKIPKNFDTSVAKDLGVTNSSHSGN